MFSMTNISKEEVKYIGSLLTHFNVVLFTKFQVCVRLTNNFVQVCSKKQQLIILSKN